MRRHFNVAVALNERRNNRHLQNKESCTLLKGHWHDITVSVVATESERSRVDEVSELRGVAEESDSMTSNKKTQTHNEPTELARWESWKRGTHGEVDRTRVWVCHLLLETLGQAADSHDSLLSTSRLSHFAAPWALV